MQDSFLLEVMPCGSEGESVAADPKSYPSTDPTSFQTPRSAPGHCSHPGKGWNLQWGNPFPGWESNPGRGNESAKSCPLDYQG